MAKADKRKGEEGVARPRARIDETARKELASVSVLEQMTRASSRQVYRRDGGSRVVHSADAASPSFGQDLEHIFRLNVARARRDNKRILGVPDFVPSKRRAADLLDSRGT